VDRHSYDPEKRASPDYWRNRLKLAEEDGEWRSVGQGFGVCALEARLMSAFPDDVKVRVGGALWEAEIGVKSPLAKPLKGFGDAGVLEVVVDFDGSAFRTVYTVRFAEAVYVLHAFQKKSKRGIAAPKAELDVIRMRLLRAREDYEQWRKGQPSR
jgi:phage-related protein